MYFVLWWKVADWKHIVTGYDTCVCPSLAAGRSLGYCYRYVTYIPLTFRKGNKTNIKLAMYFVLWWKAADWKHIVTGYDTCVCPSLAAGRSLGYCYWYVTYIPLTFCKGNKTNIKLAMYFALWWKAADWKHIVTGYDTYVCPSLAAGRSLGYCNWYVTFIPLTFC
ncbi:hypothetical protein J6590_074405 [Homalodisca vitripennis]|nr:hypothetical protein J6590_074405 [Homalodisca vitripennis]